MRPWVRPVARLAGMAVLAPWLPLALGLDRDDPLASTVAMAPLALLALWEIESAARRASGRATGGWGRDLLLVGGWLALVATRGGLGFPDGAELLAAAWFLVLGIRGAMLLVALRPLLGERLPERPHPAFFALPLVLYLAVLPWTSGARQPDGDEPYYLLLTHSIAYDADLDLADNYARQDSRRFMDRAIEPQPGDPVGRHGELYSRHEPLLPLVLAPAYRVAGAAGALVVMAALAAALAWWTLRLAHRFVADQPGGALLAYGLMATTPPLLLYATQVWTEVPAALLAVIALDDVYAPRGERAGRRRWRILLAVALLPLVKLRFAIVAAPLLALAWWRRSRRLGVLAASVAALAALAGVIVASNFARYGSPLKSHHLAELGLARPLATYLVNGSGLFFDAAFGLFSSAPLWLLLVPAIGLLVARRHPLLVPLAVVGLPYLVIVASRAEWYGGWSPPFRYGLVLLPMIALALPPLLERRHGGGARLLVAGLGVLTAARTVAWLAVPGWAYHYAAGSNRLFDFLGGRLGVDLARFFSSAVRVRPATFAWPLVCVVLVPAVWFLARRRLRRPATVALGLVLLGLAGLLGLAASVPTTVVHLEDAWVEKTGGHLYPSEWTAARVHFDGGWALPVGDHLVIPVVAGGDEVTVTVRYQYHEVVRRETRLRLIAADELLAVWRLDDPGEWIERTEGPFPWVEGRELELWMSPQRGQLRRRNLAIVERLELDWR